MLKYFRVSLMVFFGVQMHSLLYKRVAGKVGDWLSYFSVLSAHHTFSH
jgi:hypothetical protein